MNSSRLGWLFLFFLIAIPLGDSFIYDLPYVWSMGGGYSPDDSVNFLHAINRKINIFLLFGFTLLFAIGSDMAGKNKGE